MSKKVAIIGAGLAGLSAAIRLAHKGHKVIIFEKNDLVGGKAGIWQKDGFVFDTGPSLLTMKFVLDDLFEETDQKLEDHLDLIQIPILCKYFYSNHQPIIAYSDAQKFAKEIESKTTDNAGQVLDFLKYCKTLNDISANFFVYNEFSFWQIFDLRFWQSFLKINTIRPWKTMADIIETYFQDPTTRNIFYRYATYNGSSPFLAPSVFNTIANVEHNLPIFLPKNGIYELPRVLGEIAKNQGVEIRLNTAVNKIVTKQKQVTSLEFNNTQETFDAIIYAGDYWQLDQILSQHKVQKPKPKELSTSAILFYWGIKGQCEEIDLHNIIFSDDYKSEFEQLTQARMPEDPTIYINNTSKYLANTAPICCQNWFVMLNTPPDFGQNWQEIVTRLKPQVINKIKQVIGFDVSNRIVVEKIVTPTDLAKNTNCYAGSLYGKNQNSIMNLLRPRSGSLGYKNLFLAGGTVYPGGGMPLAILSGKFAANRVHYS